ncbi:MAG: hypothetical protein IPK19_16780 [Chloroflexi bacterium]|nr:hypothetical protein [Chloroflexota bacterium]
MNNDVSRNDDVLGISAPWMQVLQLDPTQWGRLYNLLIKPNRAATGLYILHDAGKVVTATPNYAPRVLGLPDVIDEPDVAAEELYPLWARGPVVILERTALKQAFDRVQRARTDGDDIFTFLIKLADILANEPGMVIHPNPFEAWRDIPPTLPRAFARSIAPEGTKRSALVAIYDDAGLYTSLLLGFESGQLTQVTTAPMAGGVDWKSDQARLLPLAEARFSPIALGLFMPLSLVERIGLGPRSAARWLDAEQRGELICRPGSLAELARQVVSDL